VRGDNSTPSASVDREREPHLHELLLAAVITSVWWDARRYPKGSASSAWMRSTEASAAILRGSTAYYEYRLGLHRERAIELARRAPAPGNLLASGSLAFCYTVAVLPRAG
jgi:hypothetical protein